LAQSYDDDTYIEDEEIKKEGSQYLPENDPNLNILIPPKSP